MVIDLSHRKQHNDALPVSLMLLRVKLPGVGAHAFPPLSRSSGLFAWTGARKTLNLLRVLYD